MRPPLDKCEVCGNSCRPGVTDWHSECSACGTEYSTLRPSINAGVAAIIPDEESRVHGLDAIRHEGYRRLLGELNGLRPSTGGTLLEVGSAYGWFLTAVSGQFDRVVGIEPDDAVRTKPAIAAVDVRPGYFPAALGPDERFDVIAFNDVLEHIPDAKNTVAAVAHALHPRGIAVLNLPISHGGIYRLAKRLYPLGIHGPFERMWQRHFPSPHLYYFSRRGLEQLCATVGLVRVGTIAMPSLRVAGLWNRIRHAEPALPAAMASYVGALAMAPIVALLPADVECLFFRKG